MAPVTLGVDLSAQPDAAAVAAAAGAAGFTVSTATELGPALEKAIAAVRGGRTAVVNVTSDPLSRSHGYVTASGRSRARAT